MTQQETSISEVETLLCLSSHGEELLHFARQQGIALTCDPDATTAYLGKTDDSRMAVVFPTRETSGASVFHAAHILKYLQLEKAGVSETLGRTPGESLWISRLIQADAEATAVATCMEISAAGEDGPRQYLETSERLDLVEVAAEAIETKQNPVPSILAATFANESRVTRMDKTFLSSARINMSRLAKSWANGHKRPDPGPEMSARLAPHAEGLFLRDPLFMGRPDAVEEALADLRQQADTLSSVSPSLRKPAP